MNKNFNLGDTTFKKREYEKEFAKIESLQSDFSEIDFDSVIGFFRDYRKFVNNYNYGIIPNLKYTKANLVREEFDKKQKFIANKSSLIMRHVVSNIREEMYNGKKRVYAVISINDDYRRKAAIDALDVCGNEKSSLLTQIKAQDEFLKTLNKDFDAKVEAIRKLEADKKFKFFHPVKFNKQREELEQSIDSIDLKISRSENALKKLEDVKEYISNIADKDKDLLLETFALAIEGYELENKVKVIDAKIADLENYRDEKLLFSKFINENDLSQETNKFMPLVKFVKKYQRLFNNKNLDIEKYINLGGYKKEVLKFCEEYSQSELTKN